MNRLFPNFARVFFATFFIFGLTTSVRSQFRWNVVHTDFDGRNYYCFDVIDCSGEVCTAAGLRIDTLTHTIHTILSRSENGGQTWVEQDPGLPVDTSLIDQGKNTFIRVQQLSAEVAIASGTKGGGLFDTTMILRTTDAGQSWQQLSFRRTGRIDDIHFVDALNGILLYEPYNGNCLGCVPDSIVTTTDGGSTWSIATTTGGSECVALGNNAYEVFGGGHGSLTRTNDAWQTTRTIGPFIDSASDPDNNIQLQHCSFTGGDTVIAYGRQNYLNDWTNTRSILIRSTDGGSHWDAPLAFPAIHLLQKMTSLRRDTVLAAGTSAGNLLMSTDRGATWRTDSLLLDTVYPTYSVQGLEFTSSGHPIAIYRFEEYQPAVPSIIIRGSYATGGVERGGMLSYHDRIFPNPASTTLNIASVERSTPFRLLDMLGRTVLQGNVLDHATLTLDVSGIPRGIYYLFVENTHGIPVLAGKLLLVSGS